MLTIQHSSKYQINIFVLFELSLVNFDMQFDIGLCSNTGWLWICLIGLCSNTGTVVMGLPYRFVQ